jgi:hypothetical protein
MGTTSIGSLTHADSLSRPSTFSTHVHLLINSYEKSGWSCDVSTCKNSGQIKPKGMKPSSKKNVKGSTRHYCKECSQDVCTDCADARASAFSYCHMLVSTGKSGETSSKPRATIYAGPSVDRPVGEVKMTKGAQVRRSRARTCSWQRHDSERNACKHKH